MKQTPVRVSLPMVKYTAEQTPFNRLVTTQNARMRWSLTRGGHLLEVVIYERSHEKEVEILSF